MPGLLFSTPPPPPQTTVALVSIETSPLAPSYWHNLFPIASLVQDFSLVIVPHRTHVLVGGSREFFQTSATILRGKKNSKFTDWSRVCVSSNGGTSDLPQPIALPYGMAARPGCPSSNLVGVECSFGNKNSTFELGPLDTSFSSKFLEFQ